MKKLIIASALSAAFVSPAVFAQATGFTGFYGQVGLGMNSAGTTATTTIPDAPEAGSIFGGKLGEQNVAGNVALGYNYSLSNGLTIGANVFYNISGDSAGSIQALLDNGDGTSSNITASNRLKNIWGISVEPGYAFKNDSLGYLKLGWAQAQNSWNLSAPGEPGFTQNFGTSNGFLYGVGFKHAINKNVYVGVEVYQIAFGKKSSTLDDGELTTFSSKPTYTYGGIVLGARF